MSRPIARLLRLACLAAAIVLASAVAADACTCASYDSPAACEVYKEFDVAFVGKAIRVPPDHTGGTVRFRLTQALKGVKGRDVTVENDDSGVGCGYQFTEGQDYVVFARRDAKGTIQIDKCSSTIWWVDPPDWSYAAFKRESADAAAFAASLRKPSAGRRIFGEVRIDLPFSRDNGSDSEDPVNGATVILQNAEDVRRTTTVDGRYEFTGLPRGTYRVSVTMPDGLPPARSARPPEHLVAEGAFRGTHDREYSRSVTLDEPDACGYAPFEVEFNGEVSGSVVRHDGSPAAKVTVEIVPADFDLRRDDYFSPKAETDTLGVYRIDHLPPGRYLVGFNLKDALEPVRATPYRQPGGKDPMIVQLTVDTHVDLGELRLPTPSAKHRVGGTVKWSDDRVTLGEVRVTIVEDRPGIHGHFPGPVKVDADGAFSTDLFEGRTYIVKAEAAGPRGFYGARPDEVIPPIAIASVTIRLDGDRRDLVLLLK